MFLLVTHHPGFPLLVEVAATPVTPVETSLGVIEEVELVNKDIAADFTFNGSNVHLSNMPS